MRRGQYVMANLGREEPKVMLIVTPPYPAPAPLLGDSVTLLVDVEEVDGSECCTILAEAVQEIR